MHSLVLSLSPLSCRQARIYDYLFRSDDPASSEEWLEDMNHASLETVSGMYITPALTESKVSLPRISTDE